MKPIETRVESVTLYHRGATVRRTADLDLSSGAPPELFLAGLPLSLVDHTVRVRLEAAGQVLTLSNVRVGLHAPPRGTPPAPPEAKEVQRVRDALQTKHQLIAQLEREMSRLSEVSVLPRPEAEEGKLPPPAPMAARAALEALFEESVSRRLELSDDESVMADEVAEERELKKEAAPRRAMSRPPPPPAPAVLPMMSAMAPPPPPGGPMKAKKAARMPVSELEQVKVSLATKRCNPKPKVDENGFATWTVELAPRSQTQLTFAWDLATAPGVQGL